jgi:hypothetical protein
MRIFILTVSNHWCESGLLGRTHTTGHEGSCNVITTCRGEVRLDIEFQHEGRENRYGEGSPENETCIPMSLDAEKLILTT